YGVSIYSFRDRTAIHSKDETLLSPDESNRNTLTNVRRFSWKRKYAKTRRTGRNSSPKTNITYPARRARNRLSQASMPTPKIPALTSVSVVANHYLPPRPSFTPVPD